MERNSGFTLIEIVVTLVLVGILSLFIGAGFVFVSDAYLKATQRSKAALQGDLVMTRLKREFKNMHDVSEIDSNSISYQRSGNSCSIRLDGNQMLQMRTGGDNSEFYPLIDDVQGFSLNLQQVNGTSWNTGDGFDRLYEVEIGLIMDLGVPVELNATVNPLYNNTYNGPRG